MTSEDWKVHKNEMRQLRAETLEKNTDALECYCVENDIDLKKNNKWHYSLFKDEFRIDYWPTKKSKYHVVSTGGRGKIYSMDELGLIFDNLIQMKSKRK